MALLIPLRTYPDSKFKILVNDVELFIRNTFNDRSSRWYLSFSDTDDKAIVRSSKLLPFRRLTYSQAGLPTGGDFYCIDRNDPDSTSELGFDSLTSRLQVYWLTTEEGNNLRANLGARL